MSCDNCDKYVQSGGPVPYIAFESAAARHERITKRLIVALVLAVVLIFASNAIWLWAWMQYDYTSDEVVTEYQQDGYGLNIIGEGNRAIYGPEGYYTSEDAE